MPRQMKHGGKTMQARGIGGDILGGLGGTFFGGPGGDIGRGVGNLLGSLFGLKKGGKAHGKKLVKGSRNVSRSPAQAKFYAEYKTCVIFAGKKVKKLKRGKNE